MNLFSKVRAVLFHPSDFFSKIEKEKTIGPSFAYYLVLSAVSIFLASVILYFWPRAYTILPILSQEIGKTQLFYGSLIGFLISIVSGFLIAGVLYLWLKAFKGRKSYLEAYKLFVYSRTPKFVFGWIPIVSYFVWIYSLVLLIIGTAKMYKFTTLKATLIYIIPLGVILLITLLVAIVGFLVLSSLLTSGVDVF